jgi:ArsR family transcriptional regulator, arsenate/arsenite/antimonite-responsive transcriptional repressor
VAAQSRLFEGFLANTNRRKTLRRFDRWLPRKMQTPKLIGLSEDQVQKIAKALADPRRYEIIKRISRSAQPLACESVRGCLEITAPTLSHHMKELEVAGLITVRRSGKFINYEFRRDVLESFLASLRREFM